MRSDAELLAFLGVHWWRRRWVRAYAYDTECNDEGEEEEEDQNSAASISTTGEVARWRRRRKRSY